VVALSEMKDGWRPKTAEDRDRTVVGFWPEMENAEWRARAWWSTVAGRAWWSMVGRKWVDGEREGKFGGKLGLGTGMRKWATALVLVSNFEIFRFQISKFLIFNFFFKKNIKTEKRKGPDKGRLAYHYSMTFRELSQIIWALKLLSSPSQSQRFLHKFVYNDWKPISQRLWDLKSLTL
jgi:hypothetical protein